MEVPTALQILNSKYITEPDLASMLNVDVTRIRDLRSYHVNGKQKFIDHIKPTAKCILYKIEDVLEYLDKSYTYSFSSGTKNPDKE